MLKTYVEDQMQHHQRAMNEASAQLVPIPLPNNTENVEFLTNERKRQRTMKRKEGKGGGGGKRKTAKKGEEKEKKRGRKKKEGRGGRRARGGTMGESRRGWRNGKAG